MNIISSAIAGLLAMVLGLIERIIQYILRVDDKKLYSLDHVILSMEVPPQSMWMNMGYWKDTTSFKEASKALLDQVLIAAKLLNEDGTPIEHHSQADVIKLVDVGIGCGDQSLYLTRKVIGVTTFSDRRPPISPRGIDPTAHGIDNSYNGKTRPLFDSYVGVTLIQCQADFARERLMKSTKEPSIASDTTANVEIFVADAANPSSWSPDLQESVLDHHGSTKPKRAQTWLLALDTLYHYKPSRDPLLRYAHETMQASFMAFDLLISDSASTWHKLILRLMCLVSGIPFSNFLTREEYEAQLVRAGYALDQIEMRDISEHVFAGIAGYIRRQDAELKKYGMTVGKFKGAAKAFGWWARTGLVRGYVVVARKDR
ncbi:hypothetical protein BDV25DRAFT_164778 [Aspergillus avenaceus]|uniref:S-adenosyl-L-methionine-dependent methyltransferase n=1 Tax=Aspergillus avenaceus TaxID=36643 RepID=A0A5N6TGE6_ASPAV|nr:hypothetical protein BDV25DRAFT_164778 [Aspergillus avenaceus]